jgi:hypothetical protein
MRVAVPRILLPLCLAVASACNCGHVNPPLLPDTKLADGTVGVVYSASLAVMGGTSPFTYTVDGAPQGLTLDNTGKLSGTPAAAGDFMLKVHVDDSGQLSADKTYALHVGDALQFKTMSLPDGTAGTAYSQTVETTGGKAPVTVTVSGALPAGLMFDQTSGTLSGTPTMAGTSMVSFTATDAASQMLMKTFSLTIADALVFNPNALPDGNVGVAYMPAPLQATGGKAPLTFSVSAGSLPGGVTLASSGAVSGTPTTPGAFNFTVSVTDANGASVSHPFTVNIFDAMPPKVVSMTLPNGVVGLPYNFDLVGTDGALPYAWTVSMGTLPAGLMLGTNGALTGTPTAPGPSTFTVLVTDANMQTGKQSLTLTVYPALQLGTAMLNEGYVSNAYAQTLMTSGGQPPYLWSVAGGALPGGVTLTTGGILAGTPTAAGSFGVAISVSDASGQTQQTAFTVNIYDLPQVSNTSLADGAVGAPYMQPLTATGGKLPYTFTLAAGTLPAGLTLAAGQIAGVPANTAVAPITVQVADANGKTGQKNFTLSVFNGLVITSSPPPDTDVGVMYSQTLSSTGGKAPITWSVSGGSLPPGLTLSAGGTLSGSPTMPGTYSYTVTATDANSVMASKMYSITISAAPVITTVSLPDAAVGTAYSLSLTSTGGKAPLTWALQSGTLPMGITFSSAGVLQGTATAASSSSLTLTLTDANNQVATKTFSFSAVNPLVVTQGPLPDAYVGGAYSQTLASSGGRAPITWAVTSGTVPAGMTLSPAGVLSGNATTPGTSAFTVTATDANSQTASKPLSVAVFNPPAVSTMSLPDGTLNVAYSQSLAANGGKSPLTWSITSGALPAGLSLAGGGNISGMPTASGTATFTVQVADANGLTASQPLTLAVFASLTITTSSPLGDSYVGAMYSQALTAAGGKSPYSWAVSSGSLPAGLSLSSGGVISGTPTAAGPSTFTVQVTDSNSLMQSKMLSLTAQPRPAISTVSLSDGYVGAPYSDMVSGTGGKPPYSWAVTTGTLPAGVSLDPASGALSGAPTGAGMSTFTLTLTDANALTSPKSFTVGVYSAPQITTTSPLTDAYLGTPFMQALAATGGKAPLSWTVSSGALPSGLTLDMTGVVSGIATAAGPAAFSVKVTDANGKTGTKSFSQTALNALTFTTTTVPAGYVGTVYPGTTLSVTGGKLPYGFAVTGGTLPAGLTLSSGGTLSGTPTAAGPTSFTVTVTDGNSVTATQTYTPTIYTAPSVTTASPLPDVYASTPYMQTLAGTGGKTPYTWSISSGALPAGLSVSPAGVVSGTTTVTGAASFTVTLTDANSVTASKPLTVTVLPALTVTTTTLHDGYVGTAYADTVAAAGGKLPYTFSISAGALPAGVNLAGGGALSGTPTSAGSPGFTVQVSDGNGKTATASLSIAVFTPPSITTTTLADGYVGTAYSGSIAGTGGKTPYTFTVTVGALPAGLNLSTGGAITGTPTGVSAPTFTVQLSDANGITATKQLMLTVNPALVVNTVALNDGYTGTAYSNPALSATGGKLPYTWSVSVGSLPAGITLTAGTGALGGAPTATGPVSFTVTVTDGNNVTASKPLSITVYAPPSITTTTLPDGYPSLAYNGAIAGAGGKTPYTFTLTAGALPAGINLSAAGLLSGAPTAAPSTYSFTVQLKDANNITASAPLAITVRPTLQVTTTTMPDAYLTVAYNQTLTAAGGKPGYTWTVGSGALPAGLSLGMASGQITGTPTAAGTSSFTAVATDANGVQASQALTIQTYALPAVTTTSPLPAAFLNTPYSDTLTVAGGKAGFTWVLQSGSLPAGVGLSTGGVLSGTPTSVTGSPFTFTVQVTDGNGKTATATLSLSVLNQFAITTASVPDAYAGTAYSFTLAATGGVAPYSNWTVISGALPGGITLAPATGTLSGTTGVTGPFTFTVQVQDATLATTSKQFTLTVNSPPSITSTSPLADGYIGVSYNATVSGSGGKTPYTWSIQSGFNLPLGLNLTAGTGVISGSPSGSAGPSTFTVVLTDANNVQVTKSFTLTVFAKPTVNPVTPGDGYTTVAYTQALGASGGKAPLTWSVQMAGTLPPGLSINAGTGALTGTPTMTGTYPFTVVVTDANLQTGTLALSISVYPLPVITTAMLPDGYLSVAYNQTPAATGGKAPLAWSIALGTLPAGLNLTASNGNIAGTPTTPGMSSFQLKVTDANGKAFTQPLSINIATALTITRTSLSDAYRSVAYMDAMTASGGKPPYTYSITNGSPPSGIVMSPAGAFSGTPGAAAVTSTFVVTVMDQNMTSTTQSLTLNVYDPLQIVTASLPDGYNGQPYPTGATLSSTGGKAPIVWSLQTGSVLPQGLNLLASGAITGTVTASATSTMFTVKATDANNVVVTRLLSISIYALPSVNNGAPNDGYAGGAYSWAFTATGGKPALTWSQTGGSLPPGLTLNPSGTLSGTLSPLIANNTTFNFTLTVTDANAKFSSKAFTLTVFQPPSIATVTPVTGTEGVTYMRAPGVNEVIAASNGKLPYTYSATNLPAGLSVNSATGVISGIPNQGDGATSPYMVTYTVTDANNVNGTFNPLYTVLAAQPILGPGGQLSVAPQGSPITDQVTVFVTDTNQLPQPNAGVRLRKNGVEFAPARQAVTDVNGKAWFSGLGLNGTSDTLDITVNGTQIANASVMQVNAALVTVAAFAYPIPSARYQGGGVWDPTLNKLLVFGGFTSFPPSAAADVFIFFPEMNDVLRLDNPMTGAWSEMLPPGMPGPSPRHAAAVAYSGGQTYLFGGTGNWAGVSNDTWRFSSATSTWSSAGGSSAPSARYGAAMTADATGGVVLFGGTQDGTAQLSDTWQNTAGNWVMKAGFPGGFGARVFAAAATTSTTKTIMLCGGQGAVVFNTCATFNPAGGGTWNTGIAPIPGPRYGLSMAAHPSNDTLYAFGGCSSSSSCMSDLYQYTAGNWVLMMPGGTPPTPRQGASMAVDTSGNVIVFGGQDSDGNLYDDTYVYSTSAMSWTKTGNNPVSNPTRYTLSGTITNASNISPGNNVVRVYAMGASGFQGVALVVTSGGAGSYTIGGIPPNDTVSLYAFNLSSQSGVQTDRNYVNLGVLGPISSNTTQNISFPAPAPMESTTTYAVTYPSDWPAVNIAPFSRAQPYRAGYDGANLGRNGTDHGGSPPVMGWYPPPAGTAEDAEFTATSNTPSTCEYSALLAQNIVAGTPIAASLSKAPRNLSPGASECDPFGPTGLTQSATHSASSSTYVAAGDLNADGFTDFVVSLANANQLGGYLSDGVGGLPGQGISSAPMSPLILALGDVNGDGRPDVAVGYSSVFSGGFQIISGQGGGNFFPQIFTLTATGPVRGVALANVAGSSALDYLYTDYNAAMVHVYTNNGDGTANPYFQGPTGVASPRDIAANDFDGDGRQDLVIVGQNGIALLLGNATGFNSPLITPIPGGMQGLHLVLASMHGGSAKDVVVVASGGTTTGLVVYRYSAGTFTSGTVLTVAGSSPGQVVAGDFNGDGKLDVAAAIGTPSEVVVAQGDGNGNLSTLLTQTVPGGGSAFGLGAADVNKDGHVDLAATDGNNIYVFLQNAGWPSVAETTFTMTVPQPGTQIVQLYRGAYGLSVDWGLIMPAATSAVSVTLPLVSSLAPSRAAPSGQTVSWQAGTVSQTSSPFNYQNVVFSHQRWDTNTFSGGYVYSRQ